jgi:hypothetical protein
VLHDLPYYLYLWATFCEDKDDAEQAIILYALFLDEQSKFKPDKVDSVVISYLQPEARFDVDGAIEYARKRCQQ